MEKTRRVAVLVAVVLAAVFAFALAAQAHSANGRGDCKGWYLDLDGTFNAVEIRVGSTVIPLDQVDGLGGNEFFIADSVANRTARTFNVRWDKAPLGNGSEDFVFQVQATRSTADCVDFDVVQDCGYFEVVGFRNDTSVTYSVAWEEGPATYDLNVASFTTGGPVTFPEDHNGGAVDVSYYLVGGEADFITGTQTDLPNFWEQSAATITVDTDCEEEPPPPVCEFDPNLPADDEACVPPTTVPPTYTCDPETGEVVEVLPGDPGYPAAVTDPSLVDCETEVAPTTTQPPAPTTSVIVVDTLPFTGPADNPVVLGGIALALVSLGGLLLSAFKGRHSE